MPDEVIDVNDITDERDALDSLDDEKDDESESESETEESTETEEENPEETESTEDDEEETEEDEEVRSDSLYKTLKAHDKEIFKKIPELKEVIFRERAYTEVCPTVDDAKEAVESAELFQRFQADVMNGNVGVILEAIENVDKDAVKTFVSDFIPSVEKMSKDLYFDMLVPEFKKLFRTLSKNSNEAISVSAKNLHFAVFGHSDLSKDEGLKREEKSEKEDKLSKREREFEERQFRTFSTDLVNVCTKRAQHIISSAFKESGLSPLMQKQLTNEIFTRVGNDLESDKRHMGSMAAMIKQARNAGFTSDWKDRITNAYLSRAKALIPKHRRAVLAEAKLGVKVSEGKKVTRITPSNSATNKGFAGGPIDPSKIDWSKTDERAALDGNFVMKK